MFFKIFVVGNFDLVLLLVVLINIFLVPIVNDVALIVVILLWLYLAKTYKNTSKESFNVGLFFIIVCPVVLIFNLNEIAEKSAIWAFMFLVAGTIQALVELRLSKVDEKN